MNTMQVDNSGHCSYGVNKCFCFIVVFTLAQDCDFLIFFFNLSLLVPHVYECMT